METVVKFVRTAPYKEPEQDPRVFALGFYDEDGAWFYTWEAHKQEEYCYSLVNLWGSPEIVVRFRRLDREGASEIPLAEYREMGLPA